MTAHLALLLALLTLLLAAALAVALRRASRARRELAQRLHNQTLALDERCDALQRQLDAAARYQRVDHLLDLVSLSVRRGRLDARAARRLEGFVLELREEARRTAEVA